MPFKSEAQRKYLWANEPGIARDWTDKHGSGIAKALGGRIPFAEGSKKTSIPEWNLATLKQALELATSDEERAKIQAQIDRVEGDIGTGADTLLGSGEAPTKGFWGRLLDKVGMSKAEGAQTGSTAEDQRRKEFFDYGTKYADVGETAYSNLKVPGLNVQHPEGLSSIGPHGFEYGNQWQTAKENEDDTQSWWTNLLKQAAGSQIGKKLGLAAGIPGLMFSGLTGGMGNIRDRLRTVDGTIQPQSYWSESARQQRRNQARVNSLIGNYIAGKNKMTPLGRRNRINQLGTLQQKRTYLHELGKQTGKNLDGSQWSNPYVDQSTYTDLVGKTDPYGNTITRDTINQDVTGMYTDDPSGIGDISAPVDDWGDMSHMIARGGLAQRAPRGSYLNGGLASLWPR